MYIRNKKSKYLWNAILVGLALIMVLGSNSGLVGNYIKPIIFILFALIALTGAYKGLKKLTSK